MIFVGRNFDISVPYYYNHHTFSKFRYKFISRTNILTWWNNLKDKDLIWGILEWIVFQNKKVCFKCAEMYVGDNAMYYKNGEKWLRHQREKEVLNLMNRRGTNDRKKLRRINNRRTQSNS